MRRSAARVWPHRSTAARRYTAIAELAGTLRSLSPRLPPGPEERRVPEAQVITVTGPRDAATLGVVDAHDHLLMDSPGMPGLGITDVDRSIEEGRDGLASGITTL